MATPLFYFNPDYVFTYELHELPRTEIIVFWDLFVILLTQILHETANHANETKKCRQNRE